MYHLKVYFLGQLISLSVAPAIVYGQERVNSEEAIKRLWSHQQRINTVKIAWEEKSTVVQGAVMPSETAKKHGWGESGIPPEDYVVERSKRFVISGDRMLYSTEGSQWEQARKQINYQKHTSVFDGKDSKIFFGPMGGNGHGMGTINLERYNVDLSDFHTTPILVVYRPFQPQFGIQKSRVKSLEEGGLVSENKCWVLREQKGVASFGGINSYWLDPAKDFLVRRFVFSRKGKDRLQIRFNYANDSERLLAGWELVHLASDGSILEASSVTVSECVLNSQISDETFAYEFPSGTRVYDKKSGVEYVARERGGKRVILPEEKQKGIKYDQLVATETGGVLRSNDQPIIKWVVLGSLLIAVIVMIYRYKRHKAGFV